MDPLELRLRNYAEVQPQSGLPWSSKALRECYAVGAERFGWSKRNPEVASMRDGHWHVGYGMAGISYSWWQVRCEARASVSRDGTAFARSAANDIGTGTRTVMQQLSAQLLGLELAQVRFDLGDSDMPWSPAAGGSGLTTSLKTAVQAACRAVLQKFLDTVADDADSPLHGCTFDDVAVARGRIHRRDDPDAGEAYTDILDRHGLDEMTADGESDPPEPTDIARSGSFAAKFVEVRVDLELGTLRVARVVTVVDGGRILNEKLARSQIIGGTVGGIGQALLEETVTDGTGRIANSTLADYLVPVNADVPAIEVVFVGEPDPLTGIGTKGVEEIGLPGTAAAIATPSTTPPAGESARCRSPSTSFSDQSATRRRSAAVGAGWFRAIGLQNPRQHQAAGGIETTKRAVAHARRPTPANEPGALSQRERRPPIRA